jgi:serine/threonine protein kinase/Flp pilus assembly protein TadD
MNASLHDEIRSPSAVVGPAEDRAQRDLLREDSILQQAYDQYLQLIEAGQSVDLEAFATPFPSKVREGLRILGRLHNVIEDNLPEEEMVARGALVGIRAGDTFQGFTLKRELGRGTFARVFQAVEPALGDRQVVVKISWLGPDEAWVQGRLAHPNIMPVYSASRDPESGLTIICMPYLGRTTLQDVLRRAFAKPGLPGQAQVIVEVAQEGAPAKGTPLPASAGLLRHGTYVEGVLHLAAQIADALASVHAQGVCHQDLKPSNVLLCPDGRPLLLDFNLSRLMGPDRGLLGGSLAYMSPEQLRALGPEKDDPPPRDGRSDLFGLGVILYELLTGRLPFGTVPTAAPGPKPPGAEVCQELLQRQQRGPRPLRELNPAVDRDAAQLIERCLAYSPEARPASAAEVAAALRRCLRPLRRVGRWLGRHRWTTAAAGLLALLVVAVGTAAQVLAEPSAMREYRLGQQAFQQGQYQQAIAHFSKSLQADPTQPEVLLARGRAWQRLGGLANFGNAVTDYERAARLMPDGRAKAAIAYCLGLQGQHATALAIYEEAIKQGFASPEVYNNLAYCYLQTQPDKREAARRLLAQALADNPKLQAAYYNRAALLHKEVLERLGKYNDAQRQGRPDAERLRAELEDRINRAYQDVGKALKCGPASAPLCQLAAWICAVGAKQDDKWIQPCRKYLKQAIALGADPQTLLADLLFDPLRGRPDFQDLLRQPAPLRRQEGDTAFLRLAEPVF